MIDRFWVRIGLVLSIVTSIRGLRSVYNIVVVYRLLSSRRRDIIVYDRFRSHFTFTSFLLSGDEEFQKRLVWIAGDRDHEGLEGELSGNVVFVYIDKKFEFLLALLRQGRFVTPACPIRRLPEKVEMYHLYHSLASMHVIYRNGAFDSFDVFLACGEHHKSEVNALTKRMKWKNKRTFEIGYPLVDKMSKDYEAHHRIRQTEQERRTILFAPSWLEDNALRQWGKMLVGALLTAGYKVIVRPHPHSFDDQEDREVIDWIRSQEAQGKDCSLDEGRGRNSFFESEVLISDWSGAAYEFAFACLKPVLFLDVKQKVQALDWKKVGVPSMEREGRTRVGIVVEPQNAIKEVDRLLRDAQEWKGKILRAREYYLFNFGNSKNALLRALKEN